MKQGARQRESIIASVRNPLGFFVLALLVIEAFLATVLVGSDLEPAQKANGMYLGVGLFVFITTLVSVFVWFKLGNLLHPAPHAIQPPDPDADKDVQSTQKAIEIASESKVEEGFFSSEGIRAIVEASKTSGGEPVEETLRIFRNATQRTWLARTASKVFLLLDDDKTRLRGRILQWSMPKKDCFPVTAQQDADDAGVLTIGRQRNWLYSTELFHTEAAAEAAVEMLISGTSEQGSASARKTE